MKHDPKQLWMHSHDCDCHTCLPQHPAEPEQLTAPHIAMLAFGGFMGSASLCALLNPGATLISIAAFAGVGL